MQGCSNPAWGYYVRSYIGWAIEISLAWSGSTIPPSPSVSVTRVFPSCSENHFRGKHGQTPTFSRKRRNTWFYAKWNLTHTGWVGSPIVLLTTFLIEHLCASHTCQACHRLPQEALGFFLLVVAGGGGGAAPDPPPCILLRHLLCLTKGRGALTLPHCFYTAANRFWRCSLTAHYTYSMEAFSPFHEKTWGAGMPY
jgi:hypothetical protein